MTELTTNRLKLSKLTLEEVDDILHLHSLPEVDRFNTMGLMTDRNACITMVKDMMAEHETSPIQKYTFSIYDQSNKMFIGMLALNLGPTKYKDAETWFKFLPENWGQGYATEALRAIISFGFDELGLHRIQAGCAVENIGSIKAMEKAGMTREGRRRLALPLKSGWSDNFEYAIVESDFR